MTTDKRKRLGVAAALACCIAIPAEGLRQYAYKDPVGILTICYGATGDVRPGQTATLEECKARLDKDMTEAINDVERCVPNLPENVLAAFGDAAFNVGPKIACGPSTANKYLIAGNLVAACNELPKWDKAKVAGQYVALPGLTKRRAAERDLCLKGAQ